VSITVTQTCWCSVYLRMYVSTYLPLPHYHYHYRTVPYRTVPFYRTTTIEWTKTLLWAKQNMIVVITTTTSLQKNMSVNYECCRISITSCFWIVGVAGALDTMFSSDLSQISSPGRTFTLDYGTTTVTHVS
jgi:hypothetical protein